MTGRKSQLLPFTFANGVTLGSSYTSTPTNIQYLDNVGVQLVVTAGSTGNFQVQVSNDYSPPANVSSPSGPPNAGNWSALYFSQLASQNIAFPTNTSPIYLDLGLLSAPWIRVVYTNTSGSGSVLTGTITAKQV